MDYQGMRTYRRFHQEPVPEAVPGKTFTANTNPYPTIQQRPIIFMSNMLQKWVF